MSRTLHITADPAAVSMAASIRAMASLAPLFVISVRALGDLADELGSMDAAVTFLLELAEANTKPIGVNLPSADGASKSVFIAPRTWTDERLQGWIGGHGTTRCASGTGARRKARLRKDVRQPAALSRRWETKTGRFVT